MRVTYQWAYILIFDSDQDNPNQAAENAGLGWDAHLRSAIGGAPFPTFFAKRIQMFGVDVVVLQAVRVQQLKYRSPRCS